MYRISGYFKDCIFHECMGFHSDLNFMNGYCRPIFFNICEVFQDFILNFHERSLYQ